MKKLIYISGIASANLLLYGALFKVMHWPGAGIMLTISILIFCLGFLPSSLLSNYRDQAEKKNKWLYIVTFIVFAVCLMGALFKIQHWPGAGVFLLIGIPLPFVLFLPIYLYITRKVKNQPLLNYLGVMFGLTFLAVFSVLLSLNVSKVILDNFELNALRNENTTKYFKTILKENPNKNKVSQKTEEILDIIEGIKCEIFKATGNNFCEDGKIEGNYNPLALNNKSTSVLSHIYAIDEKGISKVLVLKEKIDALRILITSSDKSSKELNDIANELLYGKQLTGNEEEIYQWSYKEFQSNHLVLVLDVLTRIESNVRFIENEYILSEKR